jgi:hypothetical protein
LSLSLFQATAWSDFTFFPLHVGLRSREVKWSNFPLEVVGRKQESRDGIVMVGYPIDKLGDNFRSHVPTAPELPRSTHRGIF